MMFFFNSVRNVSRQRSCTDVLLNLLRKHICHESYINCSRLLGQRVTHSSTEHEFGCEIDLSHFSRWAFSHWLIKYNTLVNLKPALDVLQRAAGGQSLLSDICQSLRAQTNSDLTPHVVVHTTFFLDTNRMFQVELLHVRLQHQCILVLSGSRSMSHHWRRTNT